MNPWLFVLLVLSGLYIVALAYLVWAVIKAARTGKDPS